MITIPHGQQVLLTRQRHEADRAGLHYDIRMVIGDKAYSWATKKQMPEVGKGIILWEQPVHTASYALSEKVIIPPGNYGAGVTTLDWVRKGKISNPENAEHKFVLQTGDGQRYLFRKTPDFGDKAWFFKALGQETEKSASLAVGAAAAHLAQNVATKAALKSKKVSQYLADSFAQGTKGVVDNSLSARAKRFISGAVVPDIAVAHKKVHEFGQMMRPILDTATPRQKVGLRMLSQGRLADLTKHNLHNDPVIQGAHAMFSSRVKSLPSLSAMKDKAHDVKKIFDDKTHPLASNIMKNISRGKVPEKASVVKGSLTSKVPLLGAAASTAVDPAGGALNVAKTVASSKTFTNTKIGKKITGMMERQFVTNPIKKGISSGSGTSGILSSLKNKAYEIGVNPVSAQLKRTSGAISDVFK